MRRLPAFWFLVFACCLPTLVAGAAERNKNTKSLSLEGKTWSLQVDLPRFKIDERETRPDGSGTMFRGASRKTGVVVSAFLEKMPELHSMRECREYYWGMASQSPLPKSQIKHLSTESMALVHWLVDEVQGIPLMQKHINAYMYRDGVCIDIHFSKVQYRAQDDALFQAVIDSVRYSDGWLSSIGAPADSKLEARSYRFGDYGAVELTVPVEWHDSHEFIGPTDGSVGLAITYESAVPEQWTILLSAFWKLDTDITIDLKERRASVQEAAAQFLGRVREETIEVRQIANDPELGYMFSVTDTEEKPGEYLNLTQGIAYHGQVVVAFSILSNGNRELIEPQAIKMLATARHIRE